VLRTGVKNEFKGKNPIEDNIYHDEITPIFERNSNAIVFILKFRTLEWLKDLPGDRNSNKKDHDQAKQQFSPCSRTLPGRKRP
jgi:hypothetical protein